MPKSLCAFFIDDAAVTALETRVPGADVNSGVFGGSCLPGLGISTNNPNLEQSLPEWTLLDQHGNARDDQIGQLIGGSGISAAGTSSGTSGTLPDATIRLLDNDAQDGTGTITLPEEGANLLTLAAGWAANITP